MPRRIILAFIILSVLQAATAQTGDQLFKKALQKFRYVEITSHKWVELDGKKQLLFPVRANDTEGWTLYNASSDKAVVDEKFEFILDYIVSSTQSGILYKENNGFVYRFWPGLPGLGTADSVQIDYLHQNKFVNDYVGITEPSASQPAYLHISGRKDALTGLPDSAILSAFINDKFQMAQAPWIVPTVLLLVDKTVHARYNSVRQQPGNIYLVDNGGLFWYLRFYPDKLDSIGPFSYAESFEEGQEFGVVKTNAEGFRVLSLRNFKLYSIPKKSNEAIDTLINLKSSNQFVCRYNGPAPLWSLLEADAGSNVLDRKIDSLAMDGNRHIKSVYKSGILASITVSSAELIPDVKSPKTTRGTINVDFNSIKVLGYSYEYKTKTIHRVQIVTGLSNENSRKQVSYYTTNLQQFKLIHNDIDKLMYHGGRFFISKNTTGWHIADLQTGAAVNPPDKAKIVWLTEFIGLQEDPVTFYSSSLLRISGEDVLEYLDNQGNLVPHLNIYKANKKINK